MGKSDDCLPFKWLWGLNTCPCFENLDSVSPEQSTDPENHKGLELIQVLNLQLRGHIFSLFPDRWCWVCLFYFSYCLHNESVLTPFWLVFAWGKPQEYNKHSYFGWLCHASFLGRLERHNIGCWNAKYFPFQTIVCYAFEVKLHMSQVFHPNNCVWSQTQRPCFYVATHSSALWNSFQLQNNYSLSEICLFVCGLSWLFKMPCYANLSNVLQWRFKIANSGLRTRNKTFAPLLSSGPPLPSVLLALYVFVE